MQELNWPVLSRARIRSQVRLLECAALTSSACAGTAERSKSQQRGFSSCHNITSFCCWTAFSQPHGRISSELQMCLSRSCFSLDRRRKIWQHHHDLICKDPPVQNTSSFWGEKGFVFYFQGKVRGLFSHRDDPRIIPGQINKLEGANLMDTKMLCQPNANILREF